MSRNYKELLHGRWAVRALVCVGLDSDAGRIPASYLSGKSVEERIFSFNRRIVDATAPYACAFKANFAFYAAHGQAGIAALKLTITYIQANWPGIAVILDAKQGDIGSTNDPYVVLDFDFFGADAVTIHNYMGMEAMKPFLDRADKGIIVLVKTSSPGSGELQDRLVALTGEEDQLMDLNPETPGCAPLYQVVAYRVANYWDYNDNCSVVVGATYPAELEAARSIVGDMPILLPGLGAQGGDMELALAAGWVPQKGLLIPNNSRGIIFAGTDENFSVAAEDKAREMNEQMLAITDQLGAVTV